MFRNWYYSITIHPSSVSVFHSNMLMDGNNYQQIFQTNNFNGNDLMVFFNWGWSGLISKLSLIRSLNLLASEGRIWKWSKSIEQLYSRKWSDTAYCVTLSKHIGYTLLLCSPSKKVVVCFTMISNFAVTTRTCICKQCQSGSFS